MADSGKNSAEENTFIKPFDDLDSSKVPIRGDEAFPLLEIVQGPKQGAWFTVAYQKEITLGRSATNSIILEDNSVSRTHSVLQAAGDGFTVRDIGSRNGTFVNGKKIPAEVPLNHKDTIKIGIYTLRYLTEATEEDFDGGDEHTPQLDDELSRTQTDIPLPPTEEEDEESAAPTVVETPPAVAPPPPAVEEQETGSQDLGKIIAEDQVPPVDGGVVPEAPVAAQAKSRSFKSLGILLAILVIFGGGGYFAYTMGALEKIKSYLSSEKGPEVAKGKQPAKNGKERKVLKPEKVVAGKEVPVFLEVSGGPVPGKVFYKGKELGQIPFKISIQVPAGKSQELTAEFYLESLGEKVIAKETFKVEKQEDVIAVGFKPKLGALQVKNLPKDGQLYLEGKFDGEAGPAKSIQVKDISYDKPVYLPHGSYVAEIRVPQALSGSETKVATVKFRREFVLGPAKPEFTISVSDETLGTFPANITSKPDGAEVLIDGKSVGKTPFSGPLPTGSHTLTLKRQGFDPYEKEINIALNTPYTANFNLETTPAGEVLNNARRFLKKGMPNQAIEQLVEALKRNPEPSELADVHMLLGDAFLQSKTYDQSLAYYQKAAQYPQEQTKAKLGQAEALAGLKQKDKALVLVIDVYLNSTDRKVRSRAQAVFKRISPGKSVLYVATEPSGAAISVNGNPIDQPTPVILSDLLLGNYRVGIQKPGFKNYETRITVPMSSIKPIVVKLEPEAP